MFKLPDEIREGLDNYRRSLGELIRENISPSRFKGIRVPWGIYSHRGAEVFMTRIRIPAGVITPAQLKALASAARKYGDRNLHITTRQDIQVHNVKIEDTIKVMEYLLKYELSPRGGGGNTVRNIITCPLSGVCRDEVFDMSRYAIALTEYLLRQETSFNLPRKFKIAFCGCPEDSAGCLVNDLGFLARYNGDKKGFKVFVGGGMGASSRIANLLEEFIPEEDLGYVVAAVEGLFYKKGDRRDRHHNRLRFLIEDIGFDEFKRLYRKELDELKEKEHIVLRDIELPQREQEGKIPVVEDAQYRAFLEYSVSAQKQNGFASVELRIPRGDISAEDLEALAGLGDDFPEIEFRTSENQNLFIVWVKNQDLYRLFSRLKDILDDFLYPDTLLDVVACKGAATCNLGLCNSPALAKEIEDVVRSGFIGTEVFKKLDIKINGCPNACGRQPLGKLSFYGVVKRVDNRPVPFYKFLIGGRKEAEKTRFAEEVGILPAKNVPAFLKELLNVLEARIGRYQDIYEFLDREAKDIALRILNDYTYVPSYAEEKSFYIDWGKEEDFSLQGLGPGECGAGVLDMIDSDIREAGIYLEEAEKKGYLSEDIKRSLFLSARALLVVKGCEPMNEEEAFSYFKDKFIGEGIAGNAYSDIKDVFKSLDAELGIEERRSKFVYAKGFFEQINDIYQSMDSSFNFPKQKEATLEKRAAAAARLDLKGTPCPINYVKTKLALEKLGSGDVLEVLLDEGEPMDNVPKSLEADGHTILNIEKEDGFYKVLVKKK